MLEVTAEEGWDAPVSLAVCHLVNERDDTLDDLVKSDYLHEAGCAGRRVPQQLISAELQPAQCAVPLLLECAGRLPELPATQLHIERL